MHLQHHFHLMSRSSGKRKVSVCNITVNSNYPVIAFLTERIQAEPACSSGGIGIVALPHIHIGIDLKYLINDHLIYRINDLRTRLSRVKALNKINAKLYDHLHLKIVFNPLCQSKDITFMTEIYDLSNKILLVQILLDISDERSVYLNILRHVSEKITDI